MSSKMAPTFPKQYLAASQGNMAPTSAATTETAADMKECSIRRGRNDSRKRYNLMRFNRYSNVDIISKWKQVKMKREDNSLKYKDEGIPKFGAGSQFGGEAREEARRKKFDNMATKYRSDDQPWILESKESTVKTFKGVREGGVSDNSSCYIILIPTAYCTFEAFPVRERYRFRPIKRFETLTYEEVEEEFSKRQRSCNYFNLMLKKRLSKKEDIVDPDEEEEEGEKEDNRISMISKNLKISDMDEWIHSSESDSSDEDENERRKKDKRKARTKRVASKKRHDTNLEAFEDSDDGDHEGRELDYCMSDSTDSEPENMDLVSVGEEKGLKKMLNSDVDSEDDSEESEKEASNEDDRNKEGENEIHKVAAAKDEKDKCQKTEKIIKKKIEKKVKKKIEKKKAVEEEKKSSIDNSSSSVTLTVQKRKMVDEAAAGPSSKKIKLDLPNTIVSSSKSGLRKLLNSDKDSKDDSEKIKKEASNEGDENKNNKSENKKVPGDKSNKNESKKIERKIEKKIERKIEKKIENKKGMEEEKESSIGNSSRSVTPTDQKRKMVDEAPAQSSSKKMKSDLPNRIAGSSESDSTKDSVKKLLPMRKLMTRAELIQKSIDNNWPKGQLEKILEQLDRAKRAQEEKKAQNV